MSSRKRLLPRPLIYQTLQLVLPSQNQKLPTLSELRSFVLDRQLICGPLQHHFVRVPK